MHCSNLPRNPTWEIVVCTYIVHVYIQGDKSFIFWYIYIYIYKYQEKEVENETRGFFENSLVTRKLFDSLRKIKHSNCNHNSMQYLFKYSS